LQKFYASKATNLSSQEILHKNVVIKKWKKDSYDRTVTRINYKWNDLAKILLKNGLARIKYISPIEKDFFYYPDVDYYNQLLEIEQYAKINKIGIWKLTLEEQKIVFSK
jgi:endonuclease YncB( thermonuclease family)